MNTVLLGTQGPCGSVRGCSAGTVTDDTAGDWSSCSLSCAVWCVGAPAATGTGRPRARLEVAEAFLAPFGK